MIQGVEGLGKAQVGDLPKKADDIPVFAAAVAVEGAGGWIDNQGRVVIGVERARAGEVITGNLKLNVLPDDLADRHLVFNTHYSLPKEGISP